MSSSVSFPFLTLVDRRRLAALSLLLAACCICQSSFAQFGGGMGGGRRGRSADTSTSTHSNSDAALDPQTLAGKVRDRLYDLRVRLLITAAQSAAWDSFSDKVWDLTVHPVTAQAPADDVLNVVTTAQQRAAATQSRAVRWQALSDAVSKLYAVLTPEQQQLANQYLPPMLPP